MWMTTYLFTGDLNIISYKWWETVGSEKLNKWKYCWSKDIQFILQKLVWLNIMNSKYNFNSLTAYQK